MKVLKFGGTSVGSPSSIKEVANIVRNVEGQKTVVLSAMSGTTNSLHEISDHIINYREEEANDLIDQMIGKYVDVVDELLTEKTNQNEAIALISDRFEFIREHVGIEIPSTQIEKNIVAQGEILSTNLFHFHLKEIGASATLVSAFDFMAIDDANEPVISKITEAYGKIVAANEGIEIFVTQGYICLSHTGKIDNLKRGGSDYSASLIGAAILAEEIQIWTDIDGMHNNDPRFVENTFSLKELSFDEAAELAYFGAKILHPQSVIPARKANVPVLLKNTFEPKAPGTIIKNCEVPNGVRAIAAKDGITAIKIKSFRMLMAYGFLKGIFEVFEKYKTSIDMVTTSEVAVSVTIDDTTYLNEIIEELQEIGSVDVDTDLSIVCLAGDFSEQKTGLSTPIFNSLSNIPIRMISYGGSNYNVSLVISTVNKKEALVALNNGVF
ncbi:aspartate kinase [Wenyingzhuangia sp. 2_MG-2023]|uniref:aspartate kinase n=1 Tax=Wenyingzhuangia sp. 2_MG-2023 TaxID=3062639 RepID=UPI0026E349E2|nr:aspartate kinase [Wenyingzhuangia sp. 2_MG-2023]MDO6736943.1 aspartate kinase [Wenyingzhuangia sp. 2_MG-2023]MDO6801887.1 aspartate kinase [Wenyingzhuangia sp. 1_MG-2023]